MYVGINYFLAYYVSHIKNINHYYHYTPTLLQMLFFVLFCFFSKRKHICAVTLLCNTSGYLEFEMDVPILKRLLLVFQKVQRLPKTRENEYQVQYIILVWLVIWQSRVEN